MRRVVSVYLPTCPTDRPRAPKGWRQVCRLSTLAWSSRKWSSQMTTLLPTSGFR
jgi:hypothetical protein